MRWLSLLKWGVSIILLIILVGIVLSDYSAGIYLALGLAVLIGIRLSLHYFGWQAFLKAALLYVMIPIVMIAVLIALALLGARAPIPNSPGEPGEPSSGNSCYSDGDKMSVLDLTEYAVEVEIVNFPEGSFRLTEHVIYDKTESTCDDWYGWQTTNVQLHVEQYLPSKIIQSVENGLFVNEVIIPVELPGFQCCPDEADVVIKNFPYNSFYDAQHVDNIKVDEYLGNETVTLRSSYLSGGIRFAYLPSPFHNLRVLVIPFIELSKNQNWILATIGFVISSIFLAIIKPNVISFITERVKKAFKKDDDTPMQKPPKRESNRNQ